jgi:hypothetical protein
MTLPRIGIMLATGALSVTAVCFVAQPVRGTRAQDASKTPSNLDYQFYKTRVEPIFLKQRGDHARCYACHSQNNSAFHLQRLLPGQTTWTEEQSRLNYERVSQLVEPGDFAMSPLLRHPLAPEGGGDSFHSGGRQFESKNDPDWLTIAEWAHVTKVSP